MNVKKSLLTSVLCIGIALPSYADIASNASSATCDSGTIGATEGSTDLEANWNANSITVNWYNGDTKITTNTCSYDGAVTIPATPTKAGYTFNGWHVRVVQKSCNEISTENECYANSDRCSWHYSTCRTVRDSDSVIVSGVECHNLDVNSCSGNWSFHVNSEDTTTSGICEIKNNKCVYKINSISG